MNRPRRCFVGERGREGEKRDNRYEVGPGGGNEHIHEENLDALLNQQVQVIPQKFCFIFLSFYLPKTFLCFCQKITLLSLSSLINLPFYFYFYFSSCLEEILPSKTKPPSDPSFLVVLFADKNHRNESVG